MGEIAMFRNLARGLGSLAFTAALAGPGFAADPAAAPAESKPLLARLNPFAQSKPTAPAPVAKAPTAGPVVSKPAAGPLSSETLLSVLREEQDAYTRRLEVCMQLRKVALEKDNDKLLAQADELERMAEITYKTRIARLGVKSNLRTNQGADDLERSLGSTMNSTPLTSGVNSPADARPATAQLKNKFREVQP
jgi:hypothetical protein